MTPYYQDDLVTIYHGDCREWLPEVDVMVTDPPYGMNHALTTTANAERHGSMIGDSDTSIRDAVLAAWSPKPAIVFGHWRRLRPVGTRHLVVWDKSNRRLAMGPDAPFVTTHEEIYFVGEGFRSGRRRTVITMPAPDSTDHPTPKPVALMAWLLDVTEGTVLDPFMGSGSTLVAAKTLGREAIGIEIEERWCEKAANRCSQEVLGLVG